AAVAPVFASPPVRSSHQRSRNPAAWICPIENPPSTVNRAASATIRRAVVRPAADERKRLRIFTSTSPLRRPNVRSPVSGRGKPGGLRLRLVGGGQQLAPICPVAHVIARCGIHEFVPFPYLPSAAKRSIDRRESRGEVAGS